MKDFFSKCEQIRKKLQIWSHLLKEILNGKLQFLYSAPKKLTAVNYFHKTVLRKKIS